MRTFLKRTFAAFLTLVLVLCLVPTVFAEETNEGNYAQHGLGLLPTQPHGKTNPSTSSVQGLQKADLPAAYDSRDYGYITPVKNQGDHNTCWTFGAAACCEAYMIKHGVHVGENGQVADQNLNLSEYHLAYYTYTDAYDAEGMLTGDKTYFLSSHANGNFLEAGGTGELVSYPLMRWTGLADESDVALMYSSANSGGLGSEHAYQNNIAHVTSVRHFFGSNVDEVKRHIMEYGAGSMGVRVSNTAGTAYHGGVNTTNGTICWIQSAVAYQDPGFYYADHDVTVVGWDDNFAKENFNQGYRPKNNGAWIVKNSWGTDIGVNGYFYVSYEDSATCASYISFFSVEDVDNYDHNYQYDGSGNYYNSKEMVTGDAIAQVFTANGNETLEAIALALYGDDTDYTVNVYVGCAVDDPTSGTLAATKSGNFDYWGYQTIELDDSVTLTPGQRFAIVITFSGDDINVAYDTTIQEDTYYHMGLIHMTHPNTSYFKGVNDSGWTNKSGDGNYRVKAFTKDIPEDPVPMDLNCYALGTVYQTISGTAGDKIALPTSALAADGWSFLGWVTAPMSETSEESAFYQPGATFKLTTSVPAVYALYMRAEAIDAPVTYELVTAMPDTWVGKYVLVATPQTGTTEYALTGLSAGTGGVNIENTSTGASTRFTSTGITRNGTTLSNVPDAYVFEVAATSYGLSLMSVSEGSYYGSKSTGSGTASYALYAYPQMQEANTTWTFEIDGDEMYLKNNSAGAIPYVAVSGSWGFSLTRYGSVFKFYKQNPTENYYYSTEIGGTAEGPAFKSQSLLLEGDIGVRFYVRLPEALRNGNTNVSFTISGKGGDTYATTVPYSEDLPTNSKGYVGFTFYVNTIQMADTITATLHYGDGETLVKTYSVKDYFEEFDAAYAAHPEAFTTKAVKIVKATADLGHYMQAYLDESNTSWSVPTDHAAMDVVYEENINSLLDEATAAVADHALTASGSSSDIKKLGYKVNFESKMSIHVIVMLKSGYTGTLTATADGAECSITQQKATQYLIEIPNVQAHQLSHKYTIEITTENGTITLIGSGLSYANMMLAGANGNTVTQNAAIALYRYSKAADIVKSK